MPLDNPDDTTIIVVREGQRIAAIVVEDGDEIQLWRGSLLGVHVRDDSVLVTDTQDDGRYLLSPR